jgi:hypothetical protein
VNNLRCTALILGSGPSGLFAADALLSAGHTDVVIVEHGKLMPKLMPKRICPPGPGCECRTCDVLEGEGGAGSFSDGKITLSATRGTHSQDLFTDKQALLLDVVWAAVRRNVSDAVDYAPVSQLSALAGHEKQLRGESYPLLPVGPVCFLNAHCRHATANRRGLAEQPQQSDGSRERHHIDARATERTQP